MVPPERVMDSVMSTSRPPDHPPPPPPACAFKVFAPTHPAPPLIFIVPPVIFTVFAMNMIFPPDPHPPPPIPPEFPDHPLAPAHVGLSTFMLIAVVPRNILESI